MHSRRPHGRSARLFVETLEDRTTPAAFTDPFATTLDVVGAAADRVNVVTADGAENGTTLAQLAATPLAAEVHHAGFGIYTVTLTAGTGLDDAVTYYSSLPGVAAAEPDYTIQAGRLPNEAQTPGTYWSQLWAMQKISAPTAWDTSTGSGNFVVAVIDSGVDYTHPDLAANMWHNPNDAIDGIDNDGNGLIDDYYGAEFVGANSGNPMDDNDHGTHVAGTIGAVGNNGLGVVGVNWGVKIMALKFLSASGSGSTSDAIEALNYAVAHGVKVSNNSWGGGGYSTALFNAIQAAQNAGHIFVAAAGNANQNIDSRPSYPASYNLANVVAVASTTSTDARSSFSNYGVNTVDIAAPGSGIVSTTPGNTYSNFSGTSMATPHVVGAIALYWDANPTATAAQVISRLTSTADVIPGLTNAVAGGRRLNVGAMLQDVVPPVPPPPSPPPPPADTAGPRVTAAAFSGSNANSLNKVRFTFNEAINPGTFTDADIASFTGPGGPISTSYTITAVSGSNNTQFDVTFTTQTAAGTYTMVIGPGITDTATPGNPMNQDNDGTNGEATQDQYTATRNFTPTTTQTVTWTGQLPIRDFYYSLVTITIDQDITVSDLNARFSLSHTYDSDLIISLIGPGGQTATLVNRRGGSANNFTNTTLDDEASKAIASGAAPFNGTYRPETALSVFDNRNARGTWTLEVYDAGRADIGTLTSFSLIITGANGGLSVTAFGFREGEAFPDPIGGPAVDPTTIVSPVDVVAPETVAAVFLAPGSDEVPAASAAEPVRVAAALPPIRTGEPPATARAATPVTHTTPALPPADEVGDSWEDDLLA